jgi:hypothetical protein
MNFAIEAPGEAAPLSPWELVKALNSAAISTDHAQRQSASQQLQTWESHTDYYTSLQVLFSLGEILKCLAFRFGC